MGDPMKRFRLPRRLKKAFVAELEQRATKKQWRQVDRWLRDHPFLSKEGLRYRVVRAWTLWATNSQWPGAR
jgi:hypothetical protein